VNHVDNVVHRGDHLRAIDCDKAHVVHREGVFCMQYDMKSELKTSTFIRTTSGISSFKCTTVRDITLRKKILITGRRNAKGVLAFVVKT
jgi:hypothetical protein